MRALLVLVAACGTPQNTRPTADAAQPIDAIAPTCTAPDAGPAWCNDFSGWCLDGACREFCDPVNYPRCAPGLVEHHATVDGADQCLCVP